MKVSLLLMCLVAGCGAGQSEVAMPGRGTITPRLVRGQLLDPTVTRIVVRPIDGSGDSVAPTDAALAVEGVRGGLRDHLSDLFRCYWRANGPRGHVDLRFRLDPDGRAQDVRARGITLVMSSCVRDVVTRIPFALSAVPALEVELRLPFYERGNPPPIAFQY